MEMCTLSERCSDSPWFSSSDGDLKGAQKSVCLHSDQDELHECHFPPLVTGHKFQSMHAKRLKIRHFFFLSQQALLFVRNI